VDPGCEDATSELEDQGNTVVVNGGGTSVPSFISWRVTY
jgi:hypothetical protein